VDCTRTYGETKLDIGLLNVAGSGVTIKSVTISLLSGKGIDVDKAEMYPPGDPEHWVANFTVQPHSTGGLLGWTINYSRNGEALTYPGPGDEPPNVAINCSQPAPRKLSWLRPWR
jgi:hypothetical protein